jgi:DNA polymerase (family 10)
MEPLTNSEIAAIFLRIGDMTDYREENSFKVRSYWRAAEVLLALPEPVADYAARGELESLPGIGEAIAGKIGEILETGTCRLYERLKGEVPPDIQRLLRHPGLTPRLARILHKERGMASPEGLREVISQGLEGIPNLNVNDRAQIVRALLSTD